MTILALPANQPETFYRGAGRIAAFRRDPELPDRPEDWIASTTSRFGLAPSGLTVLPDGRVLAEAIGDDPSWWVGPGRTDTGILVKLLDAGQRLPLHVHPDRRFAHAHLASPYGKTEAWVIVSAEPDAYVHLGFRRDVERAELAGWVKERSCWSTRASRSTDPPTAISNSGTTRRWSASTAARGRTSGSPSCAAPIGCSRPPPRRSSPSSACARRTGSTPRSRSWSSPRVRASCPEITTGWR